MKALLLFCSMLFIGPLQAEESSPIVAFIDQGEKLRLQGRLPQALTDLEHAWSLAETGNNAAIKARAAGALGALYLNSQRPKDAERLLRRSIAEATTAKLPAVAAAAQNHLGLWYAGKKNIVGARTAYQQALSLAQEANDLAVMIAAQINAARLETGSAALHSLLAAQRVTPQVIDQSLRATLLIAMGRQASALTDISPADRRQAVALSYTTLHTAETLAKTLGQQRLLSLAKGHLGALYEREHRTREALTLTDAAIRIAERIDAEDLGLQWQWQRGRLRRAQGDQQGALAAYRKAVRHIQAIRFDIPIEYVGGRSSFREMLEPVYLGTVDLILLQADRENDPQQVQALLREARDTIEWLKAAELSDYFKDPCMASPVALAAIEQIAPGTAVLYPILLPDRLELLVGFSDGKRRVAVPVSATTVRQSAQLLAERLRPKDGMLQDYAKPSAQLYDWLITPIAPWLAEKHIKHIIFVPDGPLRMVPLAVLSNGKQFVIDQYAVATEPGMSLLDPRPLPREDLLSLLVGISDPVQGFIELPGVQQELQALNAMLPAQMLLNQAFVRTRLQKIVREAPYRVVHIASHGEFGGTAASSFILTYDGRINMDQLEELMQVQGNGVPVELLSLSACQTAQGDDRAPLGLGGVAIKAGVRSALGSLWMVSDKAAQVLIPEFYTHLKEPNNTKAQALQQAQLHLLQQKDLAHPFFWGPFILMGNWL